MTKNKNQAKKSVCLQSLPMIHPNAAGIDVGAKEHVVAVPVDRDPEPVRSFKAFTPDLYELADWLKGCGVETVALESTGIYWITLYEILEERGFQVRVVNARHVKNVPGRTKTDVLDCQWIQKLHSFGLLSGSFRPDQQIRTLRSLMRLRDNLVVNSTQSVHHMQKALFEMNVQLSNVISDIVGESGMRILEAILAGERNPEALARLCSTRIKASRPTVAKSLHGNWREELLFSLRVALDSYRFAQSKIAECDERIGQHLAQFEDRAALDTPPASLKSELHRICGVDLTKIPGIKEQAAQIIISEVGLDMTRWNTEKQFASFLGLCPNNSISGGKVLRRSTRKVYNRAADALRLCSQSLTHSKTALGAKYRRLKGRLGAPKAIVAMAHHLARLVYRMLRYGRHYVEKGMAEYEIRFRLQRLKWLKREAKSLDMQLLPA
jgi:transposase